MASIRTIYDLREKASVLMMSHPLCHLAGSSQIVLHSLPVLDSIRPFRSEIYGAVDRTKGAVREHVEGQPRRLTSRSSEQLTVMRNPSDYRNRTNIARYCSVPNIAQAADNVRGTGERVNSREIGYFVVDAESLMGMRQQRVWKS